MIKVLLSLIYCLLIRRSRGPDPPACLLKVCRWCSLAGGVSLDPEADVLTADGIKGGNWPHQQPHGTSTLWMLKKVKGHRSSGGRSLRDLTNHNRGTNLDQQRTVGGDRKCAEALGSVSFGSLKQKRVEKFLIGGDNQQGMTTCDRTV